MSDMLVLVVWVLAGAGGASALAGLIYLSIRAIGYRLTPTHLQVTWLGVPVRRVRLDDIRHIGNKPVIWAERWSCAPFDPGRLLVLRRRRGWFKNFVITPERPYEFRFTMFRAIEALTGESLRATGWKSPDSAGGAPSAAGALGKSASPAGFPSAESPAQEAKEAK
jgi:hypothetical protein